MITATENEAVLTDNEAWDILQDNWVDRSWHDGNPPTRRRSMKNNSMKYVIMFDGPDGPFWMTPKGRVTDKWYESVQYDSALDAKAVISKLWKTQAPKRLRTGEMHLKQDNFEFVNGFIQYRKTARILLIERRKPQRWATNDKIDIKVLEDGTLQFPERTTPAPEPKKSVPVLAPAHSDHDTYGTWSA